MLLEGEKREKVKSMFLLSFLFALMYYHMCLYFYRTGIRIEQKGLKEEAQKVRD